MTFPTPLLRPQRPRQQRLDGGVDADLVVEHRRDCGLAQVRIRSPRPESPVSVSARAPKALPKRRSSAKPRVVSAAAALGPRSRPATMPAAIASTFLAAPPISTPRTSVA